MPESKNFPIPARMPVKNIIAHAKSINVKIMDTAKSRLKDELTTAM
jgi:hypothetical protein